jgi:hypothetical protein
MEGGFCPFFLPLALLFQPPVSPLLLLLLLVLLAVSVRSNLDPVPVSCTVSLEFRFQFTGQPQRIALPSLSFCAG